MRGREKKHRKPPPRLVPKEEPAAAVAAGEPDKPAGYEKHRERMGETQREKSRSARDISPIPEVVNPVRRARGKASYKAFCGEYFGQTFNLPWSADHLEALKIIEKAVRDGGLFAYAMPRGSGKTSLIIAAIIWATLYGFRKFVAVISSDGPTAAELLDAIKSELECNDALGEDFPEVCYAVRKLEGIVQRAKGQHCDGERTHIEWTERRIVLPSVKGSLCSGAIIQVTGMEGRIRGMKFTRPDGETVRPDLAVADDPQTDASARSPGQVDKREKIVKGAILGLAGPGKEIAGFMPCTVIETDDLADRMLDRTKHPQWNGKRTRLLYGWPKNEDLWEQYSKLRSDALRAGDKEAKPATAFYKKNRKAMDDGCRAAWDERKYPYDLSAIQHAMNLCYDLGRDVFFAEYQNEPPKKQTETDDVLTEAQIKAKANGMERGIVPLESTRLVAFIDVQKELLFWIVMAFQDDFSGHVVDYGTYPDQHRDSFTKNNVKQTLMRSEKASSFEVSLKSGLDSTATMLLGREWKREDGGLVKIERCLVDAHWGEVTDLVRSFCRHSPFASILTPSFGIYIGASTAPLTERDAKRGEKVGLNWRQPVPKPGFTRHVNFDTNWWKTFNQARWIQAAGGPGCFTIFGEPDDHRLLCRHLTAEYPTLTEGRGRTVIEWKQRPQRPDNDWLDGVVGCCVGASMAGATLAALQQVKKAVRKRVKFSEVMG